VRPQVCRALKLTENDTATDQELTRMRWVRLTSSRGVGKQWGASAK